MPLGGKILYRKQAMLKTTEAANNKTPNNVYKAPHKNLPKSFEDKTPFS